MKKFIIFFAVLFVYSSIAFCVPGDTERVSIANDGTQADNKSNIGSFSFNGRYAAFSSFASNLVTNDTNDTSDIFVYDRQNDTIERISVADNGSEGNSYSYHPSISNDGRFVTFHSLASNLVTNDSNNSWDIFLYDRTSHHIERISVANNGNQGNNHSYVPSISGDGRFVAFESHASNLVTNDTNIKKDIFVYDRRSRHIELISIADNGSQANSHSIEPSISADGRFVAFVSYASNLVPNDTNNKADIFVYDRQTGHIERVSVASDGSQGNNYSQNPSISGDGRFVTFESYASNLVSNDTNRSGDVFVYDRQTGSIKRISVADNGTQGNYSSFNPSISNNGRFISFASDAFNLIDNDTNFKYDIFVYDMLNQHIERISVASDGTESNDDTEFSTISPDGKFVMFSSKASNLVSNDTNGGEDVFVHEIRVLKLATPSDKYLFNYEPVIHPVKNSNPALAYPFATGDLAAGNLTLSVGLPEFTAPVDIYLALSYSEMPDDIFLFDSSNELQKNTIVPWKTNQTLPVNVTLYSDVPTIGLPEGTYTLYTLVVPAGATNMDNSYLWITSFNIVR